jgi:hypothetical protein
MVVNYDDMTFTITDDVIIYIYDLISCNLLTTIYPDGDRFEYIYDNDNLPSVYLNNKRVGG